MKKKYFLSFILGVFISAFSYSQISQGGTPPSFEHNFKSEIIDLVTVPKPNLAQIFEEDDYNEKNGGIYRIGTAIDVDLNMNNSGTWSDLPCGGKIWRLKIHSKGALALSLYYQNFYLPYGSKLFLYNENKKQVIGAFTYLNNTEDGLFATEIIQGEYLTIEYYQPNYEEINTYKRYAIHDNKKQEASLDIFKVDYYYRGVEGIVGKYSDINDSKSKSVFKCMVDVNCSPEGDNWQTAKRSAIKIRITDGSSSSWCTGVLLNNTAQNYKPYILTADHCGYANYNLWIFYFNNESQECVNAGSASTAHSMTGSALRARGTGNDFMLLELSNMIPESYNPHFSGWDRSVTGAPSGVLIHHPFGLPKKISTFTQTLTSATYSSGWIPNGHWRVYWVQTPNGHGVSGPGASGAGLFNNNAKVIGTLTGGWSNCDDGLNNPDLAGKFSVSWSHSQNGSLNGNRLAPWLDPINSDVITIDGIDYGQINANFYATPTSIMKGESVVFTDISVGNPNSWNWSFPGGTPSTSTSANPTVTYNTEGTYDVSLTISDGTNNDTHTKTNYITVLDPESCIFLHYPLIGTETLYPAGTSGYVSGNNSYGDLAKADFFQSSGQKEVVSILVHLGAVDGTAGNVQFAVWANNGGVPGNVIGSKTVSMATLSAAFNGIGTPYTVEFDNPVPVNGNFFAGFFTSTGSDFAVTSNTSGDAPNTAWEQWNDGTWHSYTTTWQNITSLTQSIFPEVCPLIVSVENITAGNVTIFPNPALNDVTVTSPYDNYKVIIYNNLGQIVKQIESYDSQVIIDVSSYSCGIYNFVIVSENNHISKKISIKK